MEPTSFSFISFIKDFLVLFGTIASVMFLWLAIFAIDEKTNKR